MPSDNRQKNLYKILKAQKHFFSSDEIANYFRDIDRTRIDNLASRISAYVEVFMPKTLKKKKTLRDYKTNPYVLMTSANVMGIDNERVLADFLFNTKFYMGLETSFGKLIEAAFTDQYPIIGENKWTTPIEKETEFAGLEGLSTEEKARQRKNSIWREIDKSVVIGNRRFILSIKSGPNNINDTQVAAMTDAIISHHKDWALATHATYPGSLLLDIVIGISYGTDQTTNNKENQILVKLLDSGFIEEDRESKPGVLIDQTTHTIRVYRVIGRDFWAFLGNPITPNTAQHVFLEALLALVKALNVSRERMGLEDKIEHKIQTLAHALETLQISRGALPSWVIDAYSEDELFWLTKAISSFYDEERSRH